MSHYIESLNRLARVVLVSGLVFLSSATAHESHAQALRTLQIQDGTVHIDGKRIAPEDLPASLDLEGVQLRFQFVGDADPMIAVGDGLYRIDEGQLLDVTPEGQQPLRVYGMQNTEAGPSSSFSMAFAPPFLNLPAALASVPEGRADAVGQEILQAQAAALEQLVEEMERQIMYAGTLADYVAARPVEAGQVPRTKRPAQGIDPQDAALMTEKLRFQAQRMEMAARQLPQIEIRRYLHEIQQQDAELYERLVLEQRLELESFELASQVRSMPAGTERNEHVQALRNKLEEIFEMKQENRRREIAQLEEQLSDLQHRLDERERLHQRIIDKRIQDLTGSSVEE